MAAALPAGPFETLDLGGGKKAPVYLIPFDKRGRVRAPKTRHHLVEAAARGGFTHIFLYSHGWNNDFPTALERYRAFYSEFARTREAHDLPGEYRPLLIGVVWPSTILVLPADRPPKMAGLELEPSLERAAEVDSSLGELAVIADELPDDQVEDFYELATSDQLDEQEASRLAAILQPLYGQVEEPGAPSDDAPTTTELVASWRATAALLAPGQAPSDDDDEEAFSGGGLGGGGGEGAAPEAAGIGALDPRGPVRAFTVWKMKDRAGRVGAGGVGPLLADLIEAAPNAKKHLAGHSYGAKVILSALNALPDGSDGAVSSALLLQPAINGWAFARDVAGSGKAGGYRRVLEIVRQPILTTFSKHDRPLTKLFHLAVRRKGDLGEIKAAAGAPSRYAALGGFGPQGTPTPEGVEIEMPGAGTAFPDVDAETEVLALRGDALISGHGDVVNPATAWALYNQVVRG